MSSRSELSLREFKQITEKISFLTKQCENKEEINDLLCDLIKHNNITEHKLYKFENYGNVRCPGCDNDLYCECCESWENERQLEEEWEEDEQS